MRTSKTWNEAPIRSSIKSNTNFCNKSLLGQEKQSPERLQLHCIPLEVLLGGKCQNNINLTENSLEEFTSSPKIRECSVTLMSYSCIFNAWVNNYLYEWSCNFRWNGFCWRRLLRKYYKLFCFHSKSRILHRRMNLKQLLNRLLDGWKKKREVYSAFRTILVFILF